MSRLELSLSDALVGITLRLKPNSSSASGNFIDRSEEAESHEFRIKPIENLSIEIVDEF